MTASSTAGLVNSLTNANIPPASDWDALCDAYADLERRYHDLITAHNELVTLYTRMRRDWIPRTIVAALAPGIVFQDHH